MISRRSSDVSQPRRILLVSDFFYPNVGGVESHIHALSQCLVKRGHTVVIATRSYGNRSGVRYIVGCVKVYYIPVGVLSFPSGKTSFPTIFATFPLFRNIVIRERIEIVHGHQASSVLAHEFILHAQTMGLRTCFTDHSLLGFADPSSLHLNKICQITLADIDHVICVSHTCKENTVLRAGIEPEKVSVIPNAIDFPRYYPDPVSVKLKHSLPSEERRIIIVVMSRLVYRKGVDLLIEITPKVCRRFSDVDFLIGGDGVEKGRLEEMRERHQLQNRVKLLGAVTSDKVREVLVQGDIFLNCSLTEAFCMAIIEAASCGLRVVTTKVGGIPEILPEDLMKLANPVVDDIIVELERAISESRTAPIDVIQQHNRVAAMYSWNNVARRVEIVYSNLIMTPPPCIQRRMRRYIDKAGHVIGEIFCIIALLESIILLVLDRLLSRSSLETVPSFRPDA